MAQGRATTKHRVKLTQDQRDTLKRLVRQASAAGWKLRRAQAMLKCDQGREE